MIAGFRSGFALAFLLTFALTCFARQQTAVDEKAGRTPAQKKINSELLYAIYAQRGDSARLGTPNGPFSFEIDPRGRVLIDIRADVTDTLLARVRALGGEITTTSVPARSILAKFPLDRLERLAALDAVTFIEPAPQATTHGGARS